MNEPVMMEQDDVVTLHKPAQTKYYEAQHSDHAGEVML